MADEELSDGGEMRICGLTYANSCWPIFRLTCDIMLLAQGSGSNGSRRIRGWAWSFTRS
jgi:hypothetical protein